MSPTLYYTLQIRGQGILSHGPENHVRLTQLSLTPGSSTASQVGLHAGHRSRVSRASHLFLSQVPESIGPFNSLLPSLVHSLFLSQICCLAPFCVPWNGARKSLESMWVKGRMKVKHLFTQQSNYFPCENKCLSKNLLLYFAERISDSFLSL